MYRITEAGRVLQVILCFDEPAAEALIDQPSAPPPSKLRDVYSIMAGIFVNQHLLSFGKTSGVADQRPGLDDRGGSLVSDFGQRAFLQMLDLKMVSESGSSSASFGSQPGAVGRVGTGPPAPVGGRERRRKGIPNRAVSHDSADASLAMAFSDITSDLLETSKLRCGADMDDVSPSFSTCNGVVATKAMKLGAEGDGVMRAGYSREPGCAALDSAVSVSSCDKLSFKSRGRKFFNISCKVCGKRFLQVWMGRRFEACSNSVEVAKVLIN